MTDNTNNNNIYHKLIILNSYQVIMTFLSGLLFCSLIYDDGYQLYLIFLMIPIMTLIQFYKIYLVFKYNLIDDLMLSSVVTAILIYAPSIDGLIHSAKFVYPFSLIIYFALSFYITKEANQLTKKMED